jgi:hypothetical protein
MSLIGKHQSIKIIEHWRASGLKSNVKSRTVHKIITVFKYMIKPVWLNDFI